MSTTVNPPDFSYTARFYPEIYAALLRRKRTLLTDLSEEDPLDPVMQFIEMVALVGHLNNARLDHVAREHYLRTARRRSSVGAILPLIDQRLLAASAAAVDVVGRVTRRLVADLANLVPARSRFSTVAGVNTPAIHFESGATAQSATRTDVLLRKAYDSSAGTYNAWALAADPWGAPPTAGDCLYLGHADLMFDGVTLDLAVAAANLTGVWEYSGHSEATPTAVAWDGVNLTFTLTSLLGAAARTGASVTVYSALTGQSTTVTSTWGGGLNQAVVAGTLGQDAPPSVTARDYLVSVEWTELPGLTGGTLADVGDNIIEWALPQSTTHDWSPAVVDSDTAYWLRWRVIAVAGGPVQPRLDAVPDTQDHDFFALVECGQGETVEDALGNADGTAWQRFTLSRTNLIEGSVQSLSVGGDATWAVSTEPADIYSGLPADKVAVLEEQPDGTWDLVFGDGVTSALPPAAAAVVLTYRVGADNDGNVGANAVTRNTSGVAYLTDLSNPRVAVGWSAPEGSTEADLERVKRVKPAAMRTGNRAVTADDCVTLATNDYVTAAGARPVARAWGREEAFGVGSLGLVCVGSGGATLDAATLAAIGVFFNGSNANDPDRLLVANLELVATNFVERALTGSITLWVEGPVTAALTAAVQAEVQSIIDAYLAPLRTKADGTFQHLPGGLGGRVSPQQIAGEVFRSVTTAVVSDAEVTVLDGVGPPAASVVLADDELPSAGAWVVTVNEA